MSVHALDRTREDVVRDLRRLAERVQAGETHCFCAWHDAGPDGEIGAVWTPDEILTTMGVAAAYTAWLNAQIVGQG